MTKYLNRTFALLAFAALCAQTVLAGCGAEPIEGPIEEETADVGGEDEMTPEEFGELLDEEGMAECTAAGPTSCTWTAPSTNLCDAAGTCASAVESWANCMVTKACNPSICNNQPSDCGSWIGLMHATINAQCTAGPNGGHGYAPGETCYGARCVGCKAECNKHQGRAAQMQKFACLAACNVQDYCN